MKTMICQCPFHQGVPYVVGYRRDLPEGRKPLSDGHGLVCKPCGLMYNGLVRRPFRFPLTLAIWMEHVRKGETVQFGMDFALTYLPPWRKQHAIRFRESTRLEKAA